MSHKVKEKNCKMYHHEFLTCAFSSVIYVFADAVESGKFNLIQFTAVLVGFLCLLVDHRLNIFT